MLRVCHSANPAHNNQVDNTVGFTS
ncbi:hypothetical protein FRIGORI9N_310168 [Frigoribacterium sp. 9N]|nr:hypothetical protein FRIGORI9N_310168 [Frigoribacterium sp. 9N]